MNHRVHIDALTMRLFHILCYSVNINTDISVVCSVYKPFCECAAVSVLRFVFDAKALF